VELCGSEAPCIEDCVAMRITQRLRSKQREWTRERHREWRGRQRSLARSFACLPRSTATSSASLSPSAPCVLRQCLARSSPFRLANAATKVWYSHLPIVQSIDRRLTDGCAVGQQFWRQLCAEHGIGHDGVLEPAALAAPVADRKDVFFYQVCGAHSRSHLLLRRACASVF